MSKKSKEDVDGKQKRLDLQLKKVGDQKAKLEKEKKAIDADRKKIDKAWKELDKAKKKWADEREQAEKQGLSASVKGSKGRSSMAGGSKMSEQYADLKKSFDAESKKARELTKKVAQLEAENKVLRGKLKNLSGKKKNGKNNDKRLRQLMRENRELRKKLRKSFKEIRTRSRWYKRQVKVFKNNQTKWIDGQRKAWKDKKFIIKYVFLGDVKTIKQYQKPRKGRDKVQFCNRIRVKTKGGGETTVKNVEIVVVDGDEDSGDDDDDNAADDGKGGKGKNGKKNKRKKGQKSEAEEEDELDAFIDGLAKEFGLDAMNEINDDDDKEDIEEDNADIDDDLDDEDDDEEDDADDIDDEDGDADDNLDGLLSDDGSGGDNKSAEAQLVYLRQEMDERGNDLEALKNILASTEEPKDVEREVEKLVNESIANRQAEMERSLEELNCDTKPIKESNDEWKKYVLNLSKSIAGSAQQCKDLMNVINDGFLKELRGRTKDLRSVNNVYYEEEQGQEVQPDEERTQDDQTTFDGVQQVVSARHEEISNGIKVSQQEFEQKDPDVDDQSAQNNGSSVQKINELNEALLATNVDWKELMVTSSSMFDESQSAKKSLVQEISFKYAKLQELMVKIEKLPSTVIA